MTATATWRCTRDTLQEVQRLLQENYAYPKDFAVSQVRDLLGATRKYVVPLMEHLDATGVTIRTGNVRPPSRTLV